MSPLEKMARAIHGAEWEEPFPAPGGIQYAMAMQMAKAALQAVKDLDRRAQCEMALAFSFQKSPHEAMQDAFTAAINHILKDGEP